MKFNGLKCNRLTKVMLVITLLLIIVYFKAFKLRDDILSEDHVFNSNIISLNTHKGGVSSLIQFEQESKWTLRNGACINITKTVESTTVPRHFPPEGIGTTVDISASGYRTDHFKTFCDGDLKAIVQVYSAAQNFARRTAYRDTIGRQCRVAGCRVMFVVGISLNTTVQTLVKQEYDVMKDMFMIGKVDTYNDLPNKAVAMLDWLIDFCHQPRFVIQMIDDSFINVRNFLSGLEAVKHTTRFVYGRVFTEQKPHRDPNSIYYVSEDIYPYETYPNFAVGISAAFPNSLTTELRCAVHRARYVWMADVWLFGLVQQYLGFELIDTKLDTPDKENLDLDDIDKCLFVHHMDPHDLYRFDKSLQAKETNNS